MTLSGDLPEKLNSPVEGCDCTSCQCAKQRQTHDDIMKEKHPIILDGMIMEGCNCIYCRGIRRITLKEE